MRRHVGLLVVLVLLLAAGCVEGASKPRAADAGQDPEPSGQVTVLAAASLTEAFTELGRTFEADHPGVKVTFSFGASSALARQALDGAPADLLATADEANLAKVLAGGVASDPRVFGRNRLSILVGKGNPKGIATLADLAEPDVVVVLCAPEVPCGKFGTEVLHKAGVAVTPRSLEENVKAVGSKVILGEADAGLVYVTDARAVGGKAEGVSIPDEHNVTVASPIGVLKQAANPEAAVAFRNFVLSPAGQTTLANYGFLPA
ncbi:MAG: molybdate ABC transporter substrate-binding protein [Actinomycetota bacterium]|nr:molybdate ABC transporter substrate-binding protein [Actinomycetota bacterium]